MISVEEALELVLANKREFGREYVSLLHATGRILAQPVLADRDFPAFDRVTMDGIAINYNSYKHGQRTFVIENVQAAGARQLMLENISNCIEVMTGAVLPVNTDVVIPYEQCEIKDGMATVTTETITKFQNIHKQGSDAAAGIVLIRAYETITPAIAGILASVGLANVEVLRLPRIAIFSTGEELVDIEQEPEPHQIRRSNLYSLATTLVSKGIETTIDHLPDEPGVMKTSIESAKNSYDALLFSGAVSKGKYDYLPEVLSELGMKTVFHKVAQKPGKPFLFGTFSDGPVVFAFPGNPVSTFACFHLFFRPWLKVSLQQSLEKIELLLSKEIRFTPNLDYHILVQTVVSAGALVASLVSGTNSGDLVALAKADGLLTLPASKEFFKAGELYAFTSFSNNSL
jgi:molybdopterin molybdotransferase